MPPKVDHATVIILDIGQNMSLKEEKDGKSCFECAEQCAFRIIERNIMIQTKNLVSVVLLGSNKTKNGLAELCQGSFKHIEVFSELQFPNWELIRNMPKTNTESAGDWFEALLVSAHYLKEGISGYNVESKKVVMLTNFENPAEIGKKFHKVVSGLQEDNIEVYIIGPDIDTLSDDVAQHIKTLADETNGHIATFEEAIQNWVYHRKKASKMVPQNYDLSIGPNVKIPVSIYIRIRDEPIIKNWQKAIKDPVTLTGSSTEGIIKDKKFVNNENQTISNETIQAYQYGQEIIPFSETDKNMLYKSGEKSLLLYGFTSAEKIQWQTLCGNGTYYVFGRKGDKNAHYTVTCLVHCLHESKLVGIVRKVHAKNYEPKMFVLCPIIDNDGVICLSLIEICYKESIKNMAFPPTDLKKFALSNEQVNAFKELITSMDLTKAYDDEFMDSEAFPVAETVSPSIQYVLDCISHRALNPGKPLPQPRDEIMVLFKIPSLIEKKSRGPIEKLKSLFHLKKVEENKVLRGKKRKMDNNNDQKTLDDVKLDTDMPSVQLPVKKVSEAITSIGTVQPIKDFETLKDEGKTNTELFPEMTKVIENLVYSSFDGIYTKALEAIKYLREESVNSDPTYFNNWLQKFKIDLTERKRNFIDTLSENNLGVILNNENSKSNYTEESTGDSQLYENDTIPNTMELSIQEEVNDLFDEM